MVPVNLPQNYRLQLPRTSGKVSLAFNLHEVQSESGREPNFKEDRVPLNRGVLPTTTLLSRFALVPVVVVGVISCAESASHATPDRPAPWVHFMDGEGITGWLDTSRITGNRTGPVDVTLSIDYADVRELTDDTVKYTRMDWPLALDCAGRRVQERGMILFDTAGREISRWTPKAAEPWLPIDGHASGTTTFWACRRLATLGRQPAGDYSPRAP